MQGEMTMEDGLQLYGTNVQTTPKILNTDTVIELRVEVRLIYATILPHDERGIFRQTPKDMIESSN